MLLSELKYWSFLAYSPRGELPVRERSRHIMRMLKFERHVGQAGQPMSRYVANAIWKYLSEESVESGLGPEVTLVPAPRSSKLLSGGLWVPRLLAEALVELDLGKEVVPCLQRVRAVPKAAFAQAKDRPDAVTHFETIEVGSPMLRPGRVVVVDDVVTRGATLLGAASRLAESWRGASVRGFAAMRTISNAIEFRDIKDPVEGKIEYRDGQTFRVP